VAYTVNLNIYTNLLIHSFCISIEWCVSHGKIVALLVSKNNLVGPSLPKSVHKSMAIFAGHFILRSREARVMFKYADASSPMAAQSPWMKTAKRTARSPLKKVV